MCLNWQKDKNVLSIVMSNIRNTSGVSEGDKFTASYVTESLALSVVITVVMVNNETTDLLLL